MMYIPPYVKPECADDIERWDEQGTMYRILTCDHIEDLREEIRATFAAEVADQLEINPDTSRNPMRLLATEMNILYSDAPTVTTTTNTDLSKIVTPYTWPIAMYRQRVVVVIRECLTRLDYDKDHQNIRYRVVPPHLTLVTAHNDDPSKPVRVEELRTKSVPMQGQMGTYIEDKLCWEVWDISDETNPVFRIEMIDDQGARLDITDKLYDSAQGYPYIDTSGKPVLPYILHHAQLRDALWNYREALELKYGTLRTAALWSHWCDGFVSAAHPQRVAIDMDTPAGVRKEVNGVSVATIPVDRTSILRLRSMSDTRPGTITEFSAALEPLAGVQALREYEQGLALYAGLSPSDLQVTTGQSGYAIVLSREGKRASQKQQVPAARHGDQEMLAIAARILNSRIKGQNLPESPADYHILYSDIGMDVTEKKAKAEIVKMKLDMGLISEPEALMMLDTNLDEEAALESYLRSLEIKAIVKKAKEDLGLEAPSRVGMLMDDAEQDKATGAEE